ncbi:MAG: hypothetical protein JWQ90_1365 [Hydrocarboniphaga sp.]|uniref:YjgN family protein n=1 Tax=Hydrocarboniphaga sp. TaxID=2033016 RepID=UPI0026255AC3|nr:YjgN family protein [Hydrocarboniphaga sp.]MDB5968915.1 hypothetical protein [Hydrocarboniphaga sp.]
MESETLPTSLSEPVIALAPPPAPERFRFTGDGGEYFRIWIVNIALTILTLGIYSAWAKVRRLQYFYRHTEVAGSSFDYHGKPLAILYGRIVALAMLLIYQACNHISMVTAFIGLIVLCAVLPWLLRNSFRFRMRYSSYRGLRFSFRASNADAYATFLPFGLFALIFLGLGAWAFNGEIARDPDAMDKSKAIAFAAGAGFISLIYALLIPLLYQRLKQFQHGKAWFGQTPFSFSATPRPFYAIYGRAALAMVGIVVLIFALMIGGSMLGKAMGQSVGVFVLIVPVYLLAFAALAAYVAARLGNLVWNSTMLGEHRLESTLAVKPLMWIQISNLLLVLVTVGFYLPWAMVRLARYRAENLSLVPAAPLEDFLASSEGDVGAVGEETMDMFDFDIGL